MDPLTAIGLVCNVAQLVEISWKIVSKTHEITKNGALPEQRDIRIVSIDLQSVNKKVLSFLDLTGKDQHLTDDDEALYRLCKSSNQTAEELIKRLQLVNTDGKYVTWKSFRHAIKSVWTKKDVDDTAARLQDYRSQLNTRILVSLHAKIDNLDGNAKDIISRLDEHRLLHSASQDSQTKFLTQLFTSQHELTRGLIADLAHARISTSPSTKSPVSTNLLNGDRETLPAVLEAVNERDIKKLRHSLRDDDSAIFAFDAFGQTALHIAAKIGDADMVLLLIRNGARINPDDDDGKTPLHYGVQSGSDAVVRALLDKGADIHAKDAQGYTPRDLCITHSLLEWTLTYGAQLEAKNTEGCTALHHFAARGDHKAVCALLDQNAEVETIAPNGRTPLFEAAREGHLDIASVLLSRGANAKRVDNNKDTPLLAASWRGHTGIGELLLDHDADIDSANRYGYTALASCCKSGFVGMGLMLIQRGASLERSNSSGYAPLHQAAGHGYLPLIKAILDHGGDVNKVNTHIQWTALAEACEHGHTDVVGLLIERGAITSTHTGKEGTTALIRAVAQGHLTVVERMLAFSDTVDIESPDSEGRTALLWAVLSKRPEILQILLNRGANVEARDSTLATALCRACQFSSYETAELLVNAGAKVNVYNKDLWSPLQEVCMRGNLRTAKLLLGRGANPNVHNNALWTPLHEACARGYSTVSDLLLANRADPNTQNNHLWSPLHDASHRGSLAVAKALIDHGANVDVRDESGHTPMLRAAQGGHLPVVVLLLDEGKANINAVNKDGWNVLTEICARGHIELLRALLERGARQDKTKRGETPRDLARMNGHFYILDLLDNKLESGLPGR
ncbi:MAG: Ankyrin-2 [Bogoriella megaspora]|nr:MAG: Ankyrin-2 [Bogoriella megaspora]